MFPSEASSSDPSPMSIDQSYPQEWGEHLGAEASVKAQQYMAPKAFNTLLFETMDAHTFEQLCWWLLQKDHTLTGCQRLGNKGNVSQHGIDIFAFDRLHRDRLAVFECKCWHRFGAADLTRAVDRFLDNEWATVTGRFTLILAQSSIKSLDRAWVAAHQKLLAHGIEADLWTAEHLTEKLKDAPDILTRFFSGPDIQQYCNHWMQKVGFHDTLLKAITDPRREVSALAQDFVAKGVVVDEELTTRYSHGHYWSLRQPWIDISACLPSVEDYPGSAIISIKMPDTEGVMVGLDQPWLLKHFLGNQGEPLLPNVRPFLQGAAGKQRNNHIIDLKNCRFLLPRQAAEAVAAVADEFSQAYLQSLRDVEAQWQSQNFPLVKWMGARVVLCKVKPWVWNALLEFANAHDTDNGTSEWHRFHNAHNRLMPVSAAGYHGVLFGANIAECCHGDEIAILWEPLSAQSWPFNKAGWSCMTTYQWLTNDLLPAVGRWRARQIGRHWRNWLHPLVTRRQMAREVQFWNSTETFTDVRSVPLVEAVHYRTLGINQTLSTLQGFYISASSRRAWFSPPQRAGLYEALLLLLEGGRGHLGYLTSTLSIDTPCNDRDALRSAVGNLIEEAVLEPDLNVDYVLRALLEAAGDSDDWISATARDTIFEKLMPFMVFHDQQLLIERHSQWMQDRP